MRGAFGYGTYPDGHIGCPRAHTDMTPCIARDGKSASSEGSCVGCGRGVYDLFTELVRQAAAGKDAANEH